MTSAFKNGLFDICATGTGGCIFNSFECELTFCSGLIAWFFPHCVFAQARTDYDGSNCCFNFCCAGTAVTHNIIREGYDIEVCDSHVCRANVCQGSCGGDICTAMFCAPCAAIRLTAEVRERGSIKKANNIEMNKH